MDYKITALNLQKRNRQRVNVYLDGEFAFGLARIVAAWLEVGQTLSDEKIVQLKAEDEREVAYQRALLLLNYRMRTESELRQDLQKHEFSQEDIDYVIQKLQKSGLLDDARFARQWVDNRTELRPRSRRALAYELKQRGIDSDTIDETLEGLDEDALAYQAGLKQARKLESLDWAEFRQKMISFLARRGFNYATIAPVTAQIWAEQHEDTPPLYSEDDEVDV